MYQSLYAEMTEGTNAVARDNERLAFGKAVALLTAAQASGPVSREAIEALLYVNRLWSVLLEDLAHPDNGLPIKLKADLISIGIWMLRQADDLRQGRAADFQSLIDISEAIRGGLGRA